MSSLSMTSSPQVELHLQQLSLKYVLTCLYYTGGSAKAAGELVSAQGGKTLEYLFIIGLPFLKGSDKLDAPAYTMLDAED
jgi:adenine phosphoribosyltransferase